MPPEPSSSAKPPVTLIEILPAARPARLGRRHLAMMVSFGLIVLGPVLCMAIYLHLYAADQYASRVGFTVRREEAGTAMEILGGLSRISSSSSSDTDILYKFILSQELVRSIDAEFDLRALYGKPRNDPVFALPDGANIEDLVDYWTRMVRIFYDPGTGLMEVELRAFDPLDAKRLAVAVLDRSNAMINALSAVAREDATRYANDELDIAVERLKAARQALTLFRNRTQIVDPSADIQGQMGLLNSLNAQLATGLIDLDLLTETTRESDPRIDQARRKISVIEKRISEEREKFGVGTNAGGRAYADLVGEFEGLQVDLEFAEKAYLSALTAYDNAVYEARRQSRYLAAYLAPTLAESPLYPQRGVILLVASFLLAGLWSIMVLIYYSLRDRR